MQEHHNVKRIKNCITHYVDCGTKSLTGLNYYKHIVITFLCAKLHNIHQTFVCGPVQIGHDKRNHMYIHLHCAETNATASKACGSH